MAEGCPHKKEIVVRMVDLPKAEQSPDSRRPDMIYDPYAGEVDYDPMPPYK